MATTAGLGAAVAFAGLWSGLLLTVTTLLHPMFADRDARGLRDDLGRFLPIARRSPTNYVLVLGMVVAPVVALIELRDRAGSVTFALVAAGLALVLVGAVGISRWIAEPNYDVILGWNPEALPADWERARRRYFMCNWVRGGLVWLAFACFLAALCKEAS